MYTCTHVHMYTQATPRYSVSCMLLTEAKAAEQKKAEEAKTKKSQPVDNQQTGVSQWLSCLFLVFIECISSSYRFVIASPLVVAYLLFLFA